MNIKGFIEVREHDSKLVRHLVSVGTISHIFPLTDQHCTRICLTSGKSFEVAETYDEIKELIVRSMSWTFDPDRRI